MEFRDDPVGDCIDAPRRAGWSIGDAAFTGPGGLVWLVTGHNGENLILAVDLVVRDDRQRCGVNGQPCGAAPRRGPGSPTRLMSHTLMAESLPPEANA
jgi:hypothetical protein